MTMDIHKEIIKKWLFLNYGNIGAVGFDYVVEAISIFQENPKQTLTKVYSKLAETFERTEKSAEKVIATYKNKSDHKGIGNKEFLHILVYEFETYIKEEEQK